MDPIETTRDTPALVCLIARDMRDANQGQQMVYGGPEIRTRGLELCQRGLSKRQSDLGYLTRSCAKKQTSVGLCCSKPLYIPTSQCSYLFPSRQRSTPPPNTLSTNPSLHTPPPPNLHRKPPLPIPRPPHHPLPPPALDNRRKRIQRRLTTRKMNPVLVRPRTQVDPRLRSAPQMLAPPHGGRDVAGIPPPRGETGDALAEHGVGAGELVVRGVGRAAVDLLGGRGVSGRDGEGYDSGEGAGLGTSP